MNAHTYKSHSVALAVATILRQQGASVTLSGRTVIVHA